MVPLTSGEILFVVYAYDFVDLRVEMLCRVFAGCRPYIRNTQFSGKLDGLDEGCIFLGTTLRVGVNVIQRELKGRDMDLRLLESGSHVLNLGVANGAGVKSGTDSQDHVRESLRFGEVDICRRVWTEDAELRFPFDAR